MLLMSSHYHSNTFENGTGTYYDSTSLRCFAVVIVSIITFDNLIKDLNLKMLLEQAWRCFALSLLQGLVILKFPRIKAY